MSDFEEGKKKEMIKQYVIERISLVDKDFRDLVFIRDLIKKGKIPNPFRFKHIVAYFSPSKTYRLIAKMIDLDILKKNEIYDTTYYEVNMQIFDEYISEKIIEAIQNIEELKKKLI